jgi:hypothetical protein
MNTPHRPAGSEPYIVAMANQADRANRPTKFIVVAVVLIFASLVCPLFCVSSYAEGNGRLERLSRDQRSAERLLEDIERLNNRNPNLLRLYPPGEILMPNNLREAARKAFEDNPDTETTPDFFSVGDVTTEPLETTRGRLNNNTIRVSIGQARQIPIEDILLFIQTALEDDPSGLMFLSDLHLRPTPRGWQVLALEFRRYSFNRNR